MLQPRARPYVFISVIICLGIFVPLMLVPSSSLRADDPLLLGHYIRKTNSPTTPSPTRDPPPSFVYTFFFPPPPTEQPTQSPTTQPTRSPTPAPESRLSLLELPFEEIGGVALSAQGTSIMIGGPGNDGGFGKVCIYEFTGSWIEKECMYGLDAIGAARQGVSVAWSSELWAFTGPADNQGKGAVWILRESGSPEKWTGVGEDVEGFGTTVSLSGDGVIMAVGCPLCGAGTVFVFDTTSKEYTILTANEGTSTAQLGSSLAVASDGHTIVSGGIRDSRNRGGVWVFTLREEGEKNSVQTWRQHGPKIFATDTNGTFVYQGYAVAISGTGDRFVFSSRDDAGRRGSIWTFRLENERWIQDGPKLYGRGYVGARPYQGTSLALSGDGLVLIFGGFEDAESTGATWRMLYAYHRWWPWRTKFVDTAYVQKKQGAIVAMNYDGSVDVTCSARGGLCWIRNHLTT